MKICNVFYFGLICLTLLRFETNAQEDYEPQHGISGYDYSIKGELELTFTNSIEQNNGNKQEGSFQTKSPVLLSFNLNDLKFFKNKPGEFIGYVENPVTPSCGKPCSGGLIDISQGVYGEEENWMHAAVHFKSLEDGTLSEVNAIGEIYPFIEVFFSIPDFSKEIKIGMNQLQFRLFIKGISDPLHHPVRNVTPKSSYLNSTNDNDLKSSTNEFDKTYKELLKVDKAVAEEFKKGAQLMTESTGKSTSLPISITCGTFFGLDLADALLKRNLLNADAAKKAEFEDQFEREYFKNLPRIDAMNLINYLLKPSGIYEAPIVGSFSSDSGSGSEKASYNGTLRLYGNTVKKSEN